MWEQVLAQVAGVWERADEQGEYTDDLSHRHRHRHSAEAPLVL